MLVYTAAKELKASDGSCLDAWNWGTTAGTAVSTWGCTGGNNQKWNVNANGTITSVLSGLCVEVNTVFVTNGTKLQLGRCTGWTTQKWSWR